MTACFPRQFLLTAWLCLVSLMQPACQHQAAPYDGAPALNPCISIKETPAKPITNDLVVQQLPPVPVQPATISIPASISELPQPTLASNLPPAITPPSTTTPVSYTPKRSGLAAALDSFLDHRNDDAIAALKHFPTDDQDIALVMLPLLARIDQGESWGALTGPQKIAFLESLRSLTKRLGKSAPLVLQHVTLIDTPPERYGEVKPRTNNNYYPEENVFAYAEMVNLLDYINPEGLYNVRLEVTLELRDSNDKVYWNGSSTLKKTGSIGTRNDYHITASLNLPRHLAAGAYQLVIIVRDRDTNRSARQSLPLQVQEGRTKSGISPSRKS